MNRNLLLSIVSLISGVSLLSIGTNLLFAAIGAQAGEAHFSTTVTGLVNSGYFAGFVIGTYLCPIIIRSVGHIRAFAAMASLISTLPILHALWVSAWFWGLLRLGTGVCLAGLYIVVESWLSMVTHKEYRGRIFAYYMGVNGLAAATGQWLILAGNKFGFFPFAMVSILFSFALLPLTLTPGDTPQAVPAPRFSWREVFLASPIGVIAVVGSGLVNSAFYSMGTVFGQVVGLSDTRIANFMALTILAGAACQWPIGYFSDRHDRRHVLMWVAGLSAAVAALGFYVAREQKEFVLVIGVALGGLMFSLYSLGVAHVNDSIDPAKAIEVSGGLLLLYGIGATVGPAVAGAVMEVIGGGGLMIYFAVVLVSLSGLARYYMGKRQKPEAAPGI